MFTCVMIVESYLKDGHDGRRKRVKISRSVIFKDEPVQEKELFNGFSSNDICVCYLLFVSVSMQIA